MLALDSDVNFFIGSKMSWQHDMRLLPSCLALYYVLATLTIRDNKELRDGASGDILHVRCEARQAVPSTDFKESTDKITNILSKGVQAIQILCIFAFCMFYWADTMVQHFYSYVRRQVTILFYHIQYTYYLHGDNRKQLNCDFRNPLCQSKASFGALSYAETTPWIINLEEEMLLECRSSGVQSRFITRTTLSSIRAVKMIAAKNYGRHRGLHKICYLERCPRPQNNHHTCRRQKLRKINYLWNHRKKIILQKNKRRQFKDDGSKNRFVNMIMTIEQFFLPLHVEVMKYESHVYLNISDLIKLLSVKIIYKKLDFETHKMSRQVPLDRGSSPPRENSKRRYPSRHTGNETGNERPANKRRDGKIMLRKVSCDCRCTKRSSKYTISSCRLARKQAPITFWTFIKDSIADKVAKKAPRKPPKRKLIVMLDKPKPFKNVFVESSKIHDALNLKDKTKHMLDKILFDGKGRETSRQPNHSDVKDKPDTSIHVVHPPARRERRNEQNRDTSLSTSISKTCCPCPTYLQPSITKEHSKGKTFASDEKSESEKSTHSSDKKESSKSTVESTEVAKGTNDDKLKVNEQTSGVTEDKKGNITHVIVQGCQEQNGTSQNEPKCTVRENVLQLSIATLNESSGNPLHQPSVMRRTDASISSTIHTGLNEGALITSVRHTGSQNRLTVVDGQSQPQSKCSDKQMCMKRKESAVSSTIQGSPNASSVNKCNKPQRVAVEAQQTDKNQPDKSPSASIKRREELENLNERHYQVQGHPQVSSKHSYVGNEVYLGAEISLSSLSTQQWQDSRSGISSHSHLRSGTPVTTRVFGNSHSHKYNYYYPVEDLHRQHENGRNYKTRGHNRNDPIMSLQRTEEYVGLNESGGRPHIKEVVYEKPEGHVQFVVDDPRRRLERRDLGAVRNLSRGKYTEARILHTIENTRHSPSRSPKRAEKISEALERAILYQEDPPRKMVIVKEPYNMSSYPVSNTYRPCLLTVNECDNDCARSQTHYTKRNMSRKSPKIFVQQTILESAPNDHQYKTRDHYSDPRETSYGKQYDRNLPRYAPNEHIQEESAVPIVKVPIKLHKCVDRKLTPEKRHLERKKDDLTASDNNHRHSVLEGKVKPRPPNTSSSGSDTELSVVGISGRIVRVSSNKRIQEKSPETASKIERIVHSSDKQSEHLGKERICSIHIYKNNDQVRIQPSDITVSATGSSTFYNIRTKSSVNIATTDIDDRGYNFSVEMYSGNETASSATNLRALNVNKETHYVRSDTSIRDIAPTYYKSRTNKQVIDDLLKPDFDRGQYGNQEVQHHYRCLTGPPTLSATESRSVVESELSFNKADKQRELLLLVGEAHIEEQHGSKVPKFPKASPANNMTRNSSNGSADKQYPKVAVDQKDLSLVRRNVMLCNPKISYASLTYDEETGNVTDSSYWGSDWQSGPRTNNSHDTYWSSDEAETGSCNSSLYSAQNKNVMYTTNSATDISKVERYSAPHNELGKNLPIISELSEQIDKINNKNAKYIDEKYTENITGSNMKHNNKIQECLEAYNKRPDNDGRRHTAKTESKSADIMLDFHSKQGRTANNTTQSDSLMNSTIIRNTSRDRCHSKHRRRDHEVGVLPRDRNITENKYQGNNSRDANSRRESKLGTRMAGQVYQVMRFDCQVTPRPPYNTTKYYETSKLEQTHRHTQEFIDVNSLVLNEVLSTDGQGMKTLYFESLHDELEHAIRKRYSCGDASTDINPCNAEEKLLSEYNIKSLCVSSEDQITHVMEEGYFLSYTSICDISKTTQDSEITDNRNGIHNNNILPRKTRSSNRNFSCPKSPTNTKLGISAECEGSRPDATLSYNPYVHLTHSEIGIQVSNTSGDRNDITENKLTAVMFNKAIGKKISIENTGQVQIYVEAINTRIASAKQDQVIMHPRKEDSCGAKCLVTQVIPEHPLSKFTSFKDSTAYISSLVDLECGNVSFDIRQQTDTGESSTFQDLLAERVNDHEPDRRSEEDDCSSPNTSIKTSNSNRKHQSSILNPSTSRILPKVRMYSTTFRGLERQNEEGTHSHNTSSEIVIPESESRAQNLSTVSRESKHHKKFRKPCRQENEPHIEGYKNNNLCNFKPTSVRETSTPIKEKGNKSCPSMRNNTPNFPSNNNLGLTENKWTKNGNFIQREIYQKVLDKWRREQHSVAVHNTDRNKCVKQQDVSSCDLGHNVRNKSFLQHTFSMCDGEHNIIKNMNEKEQVVSHNCAVHNTLKNKLRRIETCPSCGAQRDIDNKWTGKPRNIMKGLAEHSTVKSNFGKQQDIFQNNAQRKSLSGNTNRANETSTENCSDGTVKSTTENSSYSTVKTTTENSSYNIIKSTTGNTSYSTVESTTENSSYGIVKSRTENTSYSTVKSTAENTSYSTVESTTENSSYGVVKSRTENNTYGTFKSGGNKTSPLRETSSASEIRLLYNRMEPSMDKLGVNKIPARIPKYKEFRSQVLRREKHPEKDMKGNELRKEGGTPENSSYDVVKSRTENSSYSTVKSGGNKTSSFCVTSSTSETKFLNNRMGPSMDKLGVNKIPARIPKYKEFRSQVLRREKHPEKDMKGNELRKEGGTPENSSYDVVKSRTENSSYSTVKSGDNKTSSFCVTSSTSETKFLNNRMEPCMDKLGVNKIPARIPKYKEFRSQILRTEKNSEKNMKGNELRKKGGTTENSSYGTSGGNKTSSLCVTSGSSEIKLLKKRMEPYEDKLGVNKIPARIPKYKEFRSQVLRREKNSEKSTKGNELRKEGGTIENSSCGTVKSGGNKTSSLCVTSGSSEIKILNNRMEPSMDKLGVNKITAKIPKYKEFRSQVLRREKTSEKYMKGNELRKEGGTPEKRSYGTAKSRTENSSYSTVKSGGNKISSLCVTSGTSQTKLLNNRMEPSVDKLGANKIPARIPRYKECRSQMLRREKRPEKNMKGNELHNEGGTTENSSYVTAKSGGNKTSSLCATSGTSQTKLFNNRMEPSMDKLGVNKIPARIPKYKECRSQILRREKNPEKNMKGNELRYEGGTTENSSYGTFKSSDNKTSSFHVTSGSSETKLLYNRMAPSMDKLGVNKIPARIPKYKECRSQVLRREIKQEKNMKGNELLKERGTDKEKRSVNCHQKQHKNINCTGGKCFTKGVYPMNKEEMSKSNNPSRQNRVDANKAKINQRIYDKCSSKTQEALKEKKDNKSNQRGTLNSAVTSKKKNYCTSRGKCTDGEQRKIHCGANERSVTKNCSEESCTALSGKSRYKCRRFSDKQNKSPHTCPYPSQNSPKKNEQRSVKEIINAQNQCDTLRHDCNEYHLHNNCEKGCDSSFCITTLKRIFKLYPNLCRSEVNEDRILANCNNRYDLCITEANRKLDQETIKRKYVAKEIMKLISHLCESMGTNVSNLHHPSYLERPLKCPGFSNYNALRPYRPKGCSKAVQNKIVIRTTSHADCENVRHYLPMFRDPTKYISTTNQLKEPCDSRGRFSLKGSLDVEGYWMGVCPVVLLSKGEGTNDHIHNRKPPKGNIENLRKDKRKEEGKRSTVS